MVGSTEVRLYGIDAPELGQTCRRGSESWDCGAAASDALARLVSGRTVMCWSMGVDDYGRTLARCTSNGVDLNQRMVAQGHAVAFRKYASDYVAAEEQAKAAKLGLWSGDFKGPTSFAEPQVQRQSRERPSGGLHRSKPDQATGPAGRLATATSKAIAIGRANGSSTSRACPIMIRPGRKRFSARRPKRGKRATGGQSSNRVSLPCVPRTKAPRRFEC